MSKIYTVTDRATGELVCDRLTAIECASKLNIALSSFYGKVRETPRAKKSKLIVEEIGIINKRHPKSRLNRLRITSAHDLAKYLADSIGKYDDFP